MSVQVMSGKARWIAAGIGTVLVLGLLAPLFMLTHVVPLPPIAVRPPAAVRLADPGPANPLIRELTAMRDLAPLFLPTNRNATIGAIARRDTGRSLLDQDMAKLSLGEADLTIDRELPPASSINGRPVVDARPLDALIQAAAAPPVLGFGRSLVVFEPLRARGGYLEVVALGSGERMIAEELNLAAKPPTEKPWAPVQFLASVNATDLAAPLILAERSGVEEVDQHFRNFLAQTYRVGHRLPPGIYRVTVGP